MPFITEELWRVTAEQGAAGATSMLALARVARAATGSTMREAEAEIGWVVDLVTAIRSVRAEMNVTAPVPLVLAGASPESQGARRALGGVHQAAGAGGGYLASPTRRRQGSVQLVVRGEVVALPLKGVIDLAAERARLEKEMAKADADIKRVDAKLANADFVARAPGRDRRRRAREARGGRDAPRRRSSRRWSGCKGHLIAAGRNGPRHLDGVERIR